MVMWLRIGGALAVTIAVMALLDALGVRSMFSGRSTDEAPFGGHGRTRELFWFMVFAVVMATSVLAACRRWAGHLRRAAPAAAGLRRRNVG